MPWLNEETRWYKPAFPETAKLLSWRWIYCLPAVLLLTLLALRPAIGIPILLNGWKLVIFAVAIPIAAFASAARHALRNRKDPFCIHCGYSLLGLPDGYRCPECGQPYLHRFIDEYRRDPDFFIQRQKSAKTLPMDEHLPFSAGPTRSRRRSRDGT
jgi:hypothetical protein